MGTPILLACDFTQNVPGVNAQVQFFHQLAFQTLGGGFVRFEFAARKLPQPFQPSGSAADEHAPIRPANHSGSHFNHLHDGLLEVAAHVIALIELFAQLQQAVLLDGFAHLFHQPDQKRRL